MTNWKIETFDDRGNINRLIDSIPLELGWDKQKWTNMSIIVDSAFIEDIIYSPRMMEKIQMFALNDSRYYQKVDNKDKFNLINTSDTRAPEIRTIRVMGSDDIRVTDLGEYVVIIGSLPTRDDFNRVDTAPLVSNIHVTSDWGWEPTLMRYIGETATKIGEQSVSMRATTLPNFGITT